LVARVKFDQSVELLANKSRRRHEEGGFTFVEDLGDACNVVVVCVRTDYHESLYPAD
jgi:hypothetical protein